MHELLFTLLGLAVFGEATQGGYVGEWRDSDRA